MSGDSSEKLRLIGQDLEELDLRDFRVEFAGGVYKVSGTAVMAPSQEPEPESGLGKFWRNLTQGGVVTDRPIPKEFEREYSAADLESLRSRFVGQRAAADHRTAPDSYSASHVLRVIGAFVEEKGGEFAAFSRKGRMVTVEYHDASGRLHKDEQPFSSLLDFSTHMYRRRDA